MSIVAHLNGSAPLRLDTLDPRYFRATRTARATNALWYSSLTLALVVSLLAIFIKQWIVTFSSRMRHPAGSMQRWAVRHRAFRSGLDKWHVSGIISVLSVTLHAALLLFLLGLLVHLAFLDWIVFGCVLTLTLAAFGVYVTFTLLPLWYNTCPSLTPQLVYARRYLNWARSALGFGRLADPAPFHEDAVLAQPSVPRAVDIIKWMVINLPPGHAVNAALDAAAGLVTSGACSLADYNFSATIGSSVQKALQQAVAGTGHSSEVARRLHWSLHLDSGFQEISPALVEICTDDVFYLAQACFIKNLAENASPAIIVRVIEVEIIAPLRWIAIEQTAPSPVPMLGRTREILVHHLMQAISVADNFLSFDACASLAMTLSGDMKTDWTIHNVLINRLGSMSDRPADWRLAALHLWASASESSDPTLKWIYLHILESIGRQPLMPGYISPGDLVQLCSPIGSLPLESRSCIRGAVAVICLATSVSSMNSRQTIRHAALQTLISLVDSDIPAPEAYQHIQTILPLIPTPSRHPRMEMYPQRYSQGSPIRLVQPRSKSTPWELLNQCPNLDLQALQCIASEILYCIRRSSISPPSLIGFNDDDSSVPVIFAIKSSVNFELLRELSIHYYDAWGRESGYAHYLQYQLSKIPAHDWETHTPYRDSGEFWNYIESPHAVCDICLASETKASGVTQAPETLVFSGSEALQQTSTNCPVESHKSDEDGLAGPTHVIDEARVVSLEGSFRATKRGAHRVNPNGTSSQVFSVVVSDVRAWPSDEATSTLSVVPSRVSSLIDAAVGYVEPGDEVLDRLERQIGIGEYDECATDVT